MRIKSAANEIWALDEFWKDILYGNGPLDYR